MKQPNRLVRWLPIVLLLAASPFVFYGAKSVRSNTADVSLWLPDGRVERQEYAWFIDHFGGDDFVLVSWLGCTLEDPRLPKLAAALRRAAGPEAPQTEDQLIRSVVTGAEMLQRMTSEPLQLSRTEAVGRLRNSIIGPDGKTTGTLVRLTELGKRRQHEVIDTIYRVAKESCELDRQTMRMGGSAYEAVSIDLESSRSLRRFVIPSGIIVLLITFWCLRSVRLTMIVFITAFFCQCLSMAAVYYTHGNMNAVLIVMPTLVYVLTISGAVHLMNYYRGETRARGEAGAARRALDVGWIPCALAAGTTAIGMISLTVSQIAPVRTFGTYSAIGVLASLVVLLTFVPSMLEVWPRRRRRTTGDVPTGKADTRWTTRASDRVAGWIIGSNHWLTPVALAGVVLLGIGLGRTTTSIKLDRMFPPDSFFLDNYRWVEGNLAPLASIQVVVRFQKDCQLDTFERLELVSQVHHRLQSIEEVGNVMSAVTFVPDWPKGHSGREIATRAVFRRRLESQRQALVDESVLVDADQEELWRVTARVPALNDLDYGLFIHHLRDEVNPVIEAEATAGIEGVGVTYTGMTPLVDQAQRQLLEDLVKSFIAAFVVICPIMMLALRGVAAGLLSMIPNLVPALTIFGGMGWLGMPVDIGTVLTASVSLGIAVDGTLHFLNWYTRKLQSGATSHEAISSAFRHCSMAMAQTTLICGLGLMAFAFSTFVPAARFAWMMFILLNAALVGDLIILPTILAGPLGRAFANYTRRKQELPVPELTIPTRTPAEATRR